MAKMTKNQLIDAIAEGTQVSKGDVKAVIEQMATVGYKELNESGEFVIPGFVKMSVVNKPATEARSGVNPFTKEPMEFAAKPASKSVRASPLKVAKTLFDQMYIQNVRCSALHAPDRLGSLAGVASRRTDFREIGH